MESTTKNKINPLDWDKINKLRELIKGMTSDERLWVFAEYCLFCGDHSKDGCHCMNDE